MSNTYSDADNEIDSSFGSEDFNTKLNIIRPEIQLTDLFDGRLDTNLAFAFTETKRFANDGAADTFKGTSEVLELNNRFSVNDNYALLFGYDHTRNRAYTNSTAATLQTTQNEYYLQNQFQFEDTYYLEAGTRYTDHSDFGKHITWQVAASANFDETGTRIHGSAGTGFRAPSLNELFGPFGSDPNLDPEESKSFDLGFEQKALDDKLTFGSTAFYSEFKNEIVYSFVTFGYQNLPGSNYAGLENFVSYQLTEDLFTQLTYTRLSSDVDNNLGNNDAARRPNDTISFLIDWQATEKLNLNTDVLYYGKRRTSGFSTTELDPFWTANFKARYEINKDFDVFGRIDNLFDEDYEYASSFNTPGRSFYAGATYKF